MSRETCVTRAWRSYQSELLGFLRHRLHNDALAADLLQTVFLKALHEGRHFCELDNPRAWLYRVARNALIDQQRKVRRYAALPDNLGAESEDIPPVENLAECLPGVLATLANSDRDVIEYCELEGITQRAYADLRGLSLAAVKSRVLRARQRLRKALIQHCGVRFDAATGKVCCNVLPADAAGHSAASIAAKPS